METETAGQRLPAASDESAPSLDEPVRDDTPLTPSRPVRRQSAGVSRAGPVPATPWSAPNLSNLHGNHDQDRFYRAWELIHQNPPDYRQALELLQQNLRETPHATNIDYEHAWAMICCVHLGQFQRACLHYMIIRTHFRGNVTSVGGPRRNWDKLIAETKRVISESDDPEARTAYKRITRLEEKTVR